ncbi:hypothetical protein [Seinonella peptonophila]|uniref:hypothetical protein n=1 Tax=Seinonella peptonophila TaxID=112248 RepID=UPI001114BEA8|nr:hypothetical protein [Seinonella peptonophila]
MVGQTVAIMSVIGILNLGLSSALGTLLPQKNKLEGVARARALLWTAMRLNLIIGIITLCVVIRSSSWLTGFFMSGNQQHEATLYLNWVGGSWGILYGMRDILSVALVEKDQTQILKQTSVATLLLVFAANVIWLAVGDWNLVSLALSSVVVRLAMIFVLMGFVVKQYSTSSQLQHGRKSSEHAWKRRWICELRDATALLKHAVPISFRWTLDYGGQLCFNSIVLSLGGVITYAGYGLWIQLRSLLINPLGLAAGRIAQKDISKVPGVYPKLEERTARINAYQQILDQYVVEVGIRKMIRERKSMVVGVLMLFVCYILFQLLVLHTNANVMIQFSVITITGLLYWWHLPQTCYYEQAFLGIAELKWRQVRVTLLGLTATGVTTWLYMSLAKLVPVNGFVAVAVALGAFTGLWGWHVPYSRIKEQLTQIKKVK